jgi:tripartite-type tricarboxylate transporter receptor subunit TctC
MPDLLVSTWNGVLAPAGTPAPVVAKLHEAVLVALRDAGLRARYEAVGAEPLTASPAGFAALIDRDLARWTAVIQRAGIRLE